MKRSSLSRVPPKEDKQRIEVCAAAWRCRAEIWSGVTLPGLQWFALAQASAVRTIHSTWRFPAATRLSECILKNMWPLPESHWLGPKELCPT